MKGYVLHFFNPLVATFCVGRLTTGKDGNAWLKYKLDGEIVERLVDEDVLPINLEVKTNKLFSKKSFLFVVCGDNFVSIKDGVFKVVGVIAQSTIKQLVEASDVIALLDYIRKKHKDGFMTTIMLVGAFIVGAYLIVNHLLPQMGIVLL